MLKKYRIHRPWFLISIPLFFVILTAFAKKENEAWFQQVWCESQGGKMEVILKDFTRIDCLTPEYAIEMDFANKWREAIGQALHYAHKTERKAGVVLILNRSGQKKYVTQLEKLIKFYQLPITVWQLGPWEENL